MGYGQLKPDGYIPRIADGQLERMLATFGAVEVAGTMWCGKTWTSLVFGQSVTRIGLAGIICKGGWPALAGRDAQSSEYLDAYFDALFSVNIPRRGLSGQESRRCRTSTSSSR